MSTVRDQAFTSEDVFSFENGFNFAIGFTAFDNEEEEILDPSYGELIVQTREWGVKPDGSFIREFNQLDTHLCSEEELGLSEDKSQATFMPIDENSETYIRTYRKKMLCLNKEDLGFYGSWDSKNTRMMNIQLRKCTNRLDCKSDRQIKEFFRDKFILLLHNQIFFDDTDFNESSVHEFS